MTDLKAKIAIVTGGGSGMGQGIAVALAREGAKVVVCGRRTGALERTLAAIKEIGGVGLAWRSSASGFRRSVHNPHYMGRLGLGSYRAGPETSSGQPARPSFRTCRRSPPASQAARALTSTPAARSARAIHWLQTLNRWKDPRDRRNEERPITLPGDTTMAAPASSSSSARST